MRIGGFVSVLGAVLAATLGVPAVASATNVDYTTTVNSPSITASTTESASEGIFSIEDNIAVEANVTVRATSGNVGFTAADSIITASGSLVQSATGNVTMIGGNGDNDSDAGISLSGAVVASGNVTIVVVGNICINSITAGGTVVITASGGSITACNGTATIAAPTVNLTASTGIGSTSAIQTTASHLGATTTTGNVNITNTGTLSLDQASGVQITGASGSVDLTNNGTLDVTTAGHMISAPSSVFVQAVGATSDIATGGQASGGAITTGGSAFVQAGRDLVLGDATGFGSVLTGAGSFLLAGRNVMINANALVSNTPNGNVDVQAGGNIAMSTATGTLTGAPEFATSGGGTVTVTTGAGGAFTAASTGADAVAAQNASVFIEADSATIGAPISSGTGRTVLTVASANHPINLGSKPAGALGLTQTELNDVTAGVLQIGSPAAGNLTISNPIAPNGGNFNVLSLISGGSIIDGASTESPIVTVPNLRMDAGNGIGTTDDIDIAVGALAVGNGAGPVAIANAQPTTLGIVDGDTGIYNGGTTTALISSGALSINQAVQSGGTLTLTASDTGLPGADLTVAPSTKVSASTGDAVLLAGDNATINNGATVTGGGAVRINCDYGDANPTDSCSINVHQGGLTGSPVALRGGDNNSAAFTVASESLSGHGPLAITGAPGTNSTASVTGASVTGSPGAGLALDNLTSAAVTGGTFTGSATDGIAVDHSSRVLITGDTIWGNGGLGIDLLDGSNHGIAAPALSFASPTGGSTEVRGVMTGTAGHTFHLAFFDNPSCDPSGFGEGQKVLGTSDVTTDSTGRGSFDVTLAGASAPADAIAATATDGSSNETSGFSRCIQRADLSISVAGSPNPVALGGTLTYTVTVKNNGPNGSTGSTVIDTLPAGVSFLSASPGCSDGGPTVTCSVGAIGGGASVPLTITVKVPSRPGSLIDTATVSGHEQDINSTNNATSAAVTVAARPVIGSLRIKPKRFRAAASPASTAKHKKPAGGATVSYTDSLRATTKFTVDQVLAGRTSGRKCVAPSKSNKHGRKCTRFAPVRGSFTHADLAGRNSFLFTGRVGGRKLAPGSYRLDATPTAAGQVGQTVTGSFAIRQ
jgi:uncharacterized repeat protein (TIGR01451 family)